MKIMTKTSYDAICDIVMEQKKRIAEQEATIKALKNQVKNLEHMIEEPIIITDIMTFANPNDVADVKFGD